MHDTYMMKLLKKNKIKYKYIYNIKNPYHKTNTKRIYNLTDSCLNTNINDKTNFQSIFYQLMRRLVLSHVYRLILISFFLSAGFYKSVSYQAATWLLSWGGVGSCSI